MQEYLEFLPPEEKRCDDKGTGGEGEEGGILQNVLHRLEQKGTGKVGWVFKNIKSCLNIETSKWGQIFLEYAHVI